MQHLEVDVGTAGFAGAADCPNWSALEDALPTDDTNYLHVCICGLPAISMIDDHHVAVAKVVPACVDDNAAIRSPHGLAEITINVYCIVVGGRRVIITR